MVQVAPKLFMISRHIPSVDFQHACMIIWCHDFVCLSFLVTFGKFTPYPLTIKQAKEAGWKKDATCSGTETKPQSI